MESVDPALYSKLEEVVETKSSGRRLTLNNGTSLHSKERYKQHGISEVDGFVKQFIQNGGSFGLPLSALLSVLENDIEELDSDLQRINEIIALVLVSDTPDHTLKATIEAVVQQLAPDSESIAKMSMQLAKTHLP